MLQLRQPSTDAASTRKKEVFQTGSVSIAPAKPLTSSKRRRTRPIGSRPTLWRSTNSANPAVGPHLPHDSCGRPAPGHLSAQGSLRILASLVGILTICQPLQASSHFNLESNTFVPAAESAPRGLPPSWNALVAPPSVPELAQQDQQQQDESLTTEERLKKFRGRLPNYFGKVVDLEQRDQIYAIQAQFNEQIASLEAEIKKLALERDRQVEGVLTPEQLAEVNRMREDAKARRQSRDAAKKSGDGAGSGSGNNE